MSVMTEPKTRLATGVEARITELDLEYTEIAQRAGFSVETLAKIRQGKHVGTRSLRKLERALYWQPGSADLVMDGEAPQTIPTPEPAIVPANGTPHAEQEPPDIALRRGVPPLEDGEELKAWSRDDGMRHYRFTKTEGERFAAVSAAYPDGEPVEAVVRRMRTSANVVLM